MAKAPIPTQYDLIGNEIKVDAYVTFATGNGNVALGKVTRVWDRAARGRSHPDREVRVDIDVVLSQELVEYHANPPAHYYQPRKDMTAKVENVMVITPDMKQLAMIAKLAM
ncbi:hypothetical protein D3C87_1362830 [compost metagenome]